MIKANDIRIGNIVNTSSLFTHPEINFLVQRIAVINTIDNIVRDGTDNIYTFDELYPIPLTPEILEKCGFEKIVEGNATSVYGHKASKYLEFHWLKKEGLLNLNHAAAQSLSSLHQLQNLYFALTGNELEINLEGVL